MSRNRQVELGLVAIGLVIVAFYLATLVLVTELTGAAEDVQSAMPPVEVAE